MSSLADQWLTDRSQVRVRKYLGIVFFMLALTTANGVMFAISTTQKPSAVASDRPISLARNPVGPIASTALLRPKSHAR